MNGAKLNNRFMAWDIGPLYRNKHKGSVLKIIIRRMQRAQEKRMASKEIADEVSS
jgi:hypothetical protein